MPAHNPLASLAPDWSAEFISRTQSEFRAFLERAAEAGGVASKAHTRPTDPASWGPQALLRLAIAQGLTEANVREVFAAARSPLKDAYLKVAQATRHAAGDIEVDEDASVSFKAARGAYVQAWVWVDLDELPRPQTFLEAAVRLRENAIEWALTLDEVPVSVSWSPMGELVVHLEDVDGASGDRTVDMEELRSAERADDLGYRWRLPDGCCLEIRLAE